MLIRTVGTDMDEVLADLVTPILDYHNLKYGTNLSREDVYSYNFWEVRGGTREQAIRKVCDFYRSEDFKHIKPVTGSQEVTKLLCERHKLVVITSRPNDIYDETMRWINQYFPDRFLEVHCTNQYTGMDSSKRKSDVCLELKVDVMIEDSLEHAKECASYGVRVLLLDCPWNQSNDLPPRITRVKSWEEILEKFKDGFL